jgi:predicted TIM-barrel fold metal-dependent hydrolase
VYVKISHTWSISSQGYPWQDTHDMAKAVYQAFGGSRIMWGTDWPVCLANATYGQTLSVVRDEMTFIAPEDMPRVLGGTALDLWTFEDLRA